MAAVIKDLDTGRILYSKNETDPLYPASTVKIMTAILALEALGGEDPNTPITAGLSVNNARGVTHGIMNRETFRLEDLLYMLMMRGANDATVVLAEHIAGSEAAFVTMMNDKAREIGCTNTIFTNATGLHMPAMLTTAEDVAVMAHYAYHFEHAEKYLEMSSAFTWSLPDTNLRRNITPLLNRNHFVSGAVERQYRYRDARGMNSGGTPEAGNALVTTASRNGMNYLCVIMGAVDTNAFTDARDLLDWAFSLFEKKTVVTTRDFVKEVTIELAANMNNSTVKLSPAEDIEAILPATVNVRTDVETVFSINGELLVAPITRGTVLGEVWFLYNGQVIGHTELLADSDIERNSMLYNLERVRRVVTSTWFIASAVCFVLFVGAYFIISTIRYRRTRQERWG
jgi:D-alanyl-D-alanine carboxypeptidase (penicillin-binding protein 5/6)